jgi:S1-C subfamily serine protease
MPGITRSRSFHRKRPLLAAVAFALSLLLSPSLAPHAARAQALNVDELVSAVVRIRASINPDGRTTETLGHERSGNGIVIDKSGLVLTIGYLMVEAHMAEIETGSGRRVAAEIVGYDYDTGFGLLRAQAPLDVRPLELGRSGDLKVGDKVLVVRSGGVVALGPAAIAAKREFAGYWEYLLEEAIFTSPPYAEWSGSALVNRDGRLVGVGSLIVSDGSGKGDGPPSNMFVPIDLLPPILAELLRDGRVSGVPKPWLGLSTDETDGRLVVRRVAPGSPADRSGVRRGDTIVAVGGQSTRSLPDFYRRVWSLGPAGVTVPLEVVRDGASQMFQIPSINRLKHLKLNPTL